MSQINEKSFEGAIAKLGEPDTFESWSLDSGNLRAFLAAFLQAEATRGFQMMPVKEEKRSEQELHSTSSGWGFCSFCQTRRHLPCRNEFEAGVCPPPRDASGAGGAEP